MQLPPRLIHSGPPEEQQSSSISSHEQSLQHQPKGIADAFKQNEDEEEEEEEEEDFLPPPPPNQPAPIPTSTDVGMPLSRPLAFARHQNETTAGAAGQGSQQGSGGAVEHGRKNTAAAVHGNTSERGAIQEGMIVDRQGTGGGATGAGGGRAGEQTGRDAAGNEMDVDQGSSGIVGGDLMVDRQGTRGGATGSGGGRAGESGRDAAGNEMDIDRGSSGIVGGDLMPAAAEDTAATVHGNTSERGATQEGMIVDRQGTGGGATGSGGGGAGESGRDATGNEMDVDRGSSGIVGDLMPATKGGIRSSTRKRKTPPPPPEPTGASKPKRKSKPKSKPKPKPEPESKPKRMRMKSASEGGILNYFEEIQINGGSRVVDMYDLTQTMVFLPSFKILALLIITLQRDPAKPNIQKTREVCVSHFCMREHHKPYFLQEIHRGEPVPLLSPTGETFMYTPAFHVSLLY
jgi:hypothetical protein